MKYCLDEAPFRKRSEVVRVIELSDKLNTAEKNAILNTENNWRKLFQYQLFSDYDSYVESLIDVFIDTKDVEKESLPYNTICRRYREAELIPFFDDLRLRGLTPDKVGNMPAFIELYEKINKRLELRENNER